MDVLKEMLAKDWPVNYYYLAEKPLHTACAEGRIDFVQVLLEHKADVNAHGLPIRSKGLPNNALYFALANDDVELLKLLLSGFRSDHMTPLHYACIQGATKCAEYLLVTEKGSANTMAKNFSMPLEIAVRTSMGLTDLLLKSGASLQHPMRDNLSALHHAMKVRNNAKPKIDDMQAIAPIAQLLLRNGANFNDTAGHNNLMHIIFYQVQEIFLNICHDKRNISDVESSWRGIREAAQVVLDAGLKVTNSDVFTTFRMNIEILTARSPDSDERYSPAISQALSKAIDLLILLWPKTIRDNTHNNVFPIIDALMGVLPMVILKLKRTASSAQCALFCHTFSSMICRLFFCLPFREVTADTVQSILDALVPVEVDEKRELLLLILCLTPMQNLHLLTSLPQDVYDKRLTLQTLSKLAILRLLPYPKADNIDLLPIPIGMKENFLLGP